MSLRHVLSYLLVAGVCLGLSACASLEEVNETLLYPGNWPSISKKLTGENCPDLAGKFENEVFQFLPDNNADTPRSLTSILERMSVSSYPPSGASATERAAKAWRVPSVAASVIITQSNGLLGIRFFNATQGDAGLTFRHSNAPLLEVRLDDVFICEDAETAPRLRFMVEIDRVAGGAPFLGAGLARTIVSLSRAIDGSLVARWNRQSAGFLVMVPYVRNENTWLRFRSMPSVPK